MATSDRLPVGTKPELLEAYSKLKALAVQNKDAVHQPLRTRAAAAVEEIKSELSQKTAQLEELERQIEDLKQELAQSKRVVLTQEALGLLLEKFNQEQAEWERRKRLLDEELAQKASTIKKRIEKEFDEKKGAATREESHGKRKDNDFSPLKSTSEIFSSKPVKDIQSALMTNLKDY
jgi:chromosome segregation ATPase